MISETPGFACPQCAGWIPVTIHHLLRRERFYCMSCGLELHLDGQQPVMQHLSELQSSGKLPPEGDHG